MKKLPIFLSFLLTIFWISLCHRCPAQTDLNYYLQQSRVNSPLIRENQNLSEISRLEAERWKAFYTQPQVTLTGNLLVSPVLNQDGGTSKLDLTPNSPTHYTGYDQAITNAGLYQALLTVTQPIFNGARANAFGQQALALGQTSANLAQLTGHDIERSVTDQYLLCHLDFQQMAYVEELLQIITEQRTVLGRLVQSGLYKQSDWTLLNIEYQTQQTAYQAYRATYRRDLMDLNALAGVNDTTFHLLKAPVLSLKGEVTDSQYLLKYRLDSLNLAATQQVFELKYKPTLSAFANTGLNAVTVPTLPNRFGMSAGLTFTMSLYDGRQKQLSRRKTELGTQSIQAYRQNFLQQNNVRKSKALGELAALDERLSITANQLSDYGKLLDFYKKELMTGQISVINYLATLKNFAASRRDFLLMETNRLQLINAYNYWNW